MTAVLAVLALWHFTYVLEGAAATGDGFLRSGYAVLALGAVALSAMAGILWLAGPYRFEAVLAAVMLLMGIVSLRTLPGLSAPDEPTHYITAYHLSDRLMLQEADDEEGHVYIRAEDFALEDLDDEIDDFKAGLTDGTLILGQDMTERTYREIHEWKQLHPREEGTAVSYQPRLETTPLVYLPQALGITLARLLGFNPIGLVTLGRFFNLLAFTAMLYFSVRRMPFGKEVTAACALLPMTVHLAASMSYDAMLIALSWLYIAHVLYFAYEKETLGWKDIAVLAVILAVLAPCKLVYGILVLLLLLIPRDKFKDRKLYACLWAVCAAGVIISLLLVNAAIIAGYAQEEENVLAWAGEAGYTMAYCVRHPLRVLRIVYDTAVWQAEYYHLTMLGSYLGNADPSLDVPYLVVAALGVFLLLLPLKKPGDARELSGKDRIVIAGTALLLTGMLMGSMLIGWTPLSSPVILGVQGRYFLPVLPAVLLLARNRTVVLSRDVSRELLYLTVCCGAYAFLRLYSMITLHI